MTRPPHVEDVPELEPEALAALVAEYLTKMKVADWWKGPESPSRTEADGVVVLGHRSGTNVLSAFVKACYDIGFCFPFRWTVFSEEGRRLVEEPRAIEEASLLQLRKLLTMIVRADR